MPKNFIFLHVNSMLVWRIVMVEIRLKRERVVGVCPPFPPITSWMSLHVPSIRWVCWKCGSWWRPRVVWQSLEIPLDNPSSRNHSDVSSVVIPMIHHVILEVYPLHLAPHSRFSQAGTLRLEVPLDVLRRSKRNRQMYPMWKLVSVEPMHGVWADWIPTLQLRFILMLPIQATHQFQREKEDTFNSSPSIFIPVERHVFELRPSVDHGPILRLKWLIHNNKINSREKCNQI
mmetsp:Transcript_19100/g.26894  ORF Transcript_19100/g.26894 Transcript_19100/m.26894 type:complete len:231 (-) Transcript_19100:1070-1762(-)